MKRMTDWIRFDFGSRAKTDGCAPARAQSARPEEQTVQKGNFYE